MIPSASMGCEAPLPTLSPLLENLVQEQQGRMCWGELVTSQAHLLTLALNPMLQLPRLIQSQKPLWLKCQARCSLAARQLNTLPCPSAQVQAPCAVLQQATEHMAD